MNRVKFTTVTLDRETIARIKAAAGDLSVALYVRELSKRLDEVPTFARLKDLEKRIGAIEGVEARVSNLSVELQELKGLLSYRNAQGGQVSVDHDKVPGSRTAFVRPAGSSPGSQLDFSGMPAAAPQTDVLMIQKALEENPGVTRVGWYRLVEGVWQFDKEGYSAWETEFEALRDQGYTGREAERIMSERREGKERR